MFTFPVTLCMLWTKVTMGGTSQLAVNGRRCVAHLRFGVPACAAQQLDPPSCGVLRGRKATTQNSTRSRIVSGCPQGSYS